MSLHDIRAKYPMEDVQVDEAVKTLITDETVLFLTQLGVPKLEPSFRFKAFNQKLGMENIREFRGVRYIVLCEGRFSDICLTEGKNEVVFVPHAVNPDVQSHDENITYINKDYKAYITCLVIFRSSMEEFIKIRKQIETSSTQVELDAGYAKLNNFFDKLEEQLALIDQLAIVGQDSWWSNNLADLRENY
ncbi:MAG: hypothetical protein OHK0046_46220 [Anaerolineae bacterium]